MKSRLDGGKAGGQMAHYKKAIAATQCHQDEEKDKFEKYSEGSCNRT
jgi:hypothetical protein